MAFGSKMDKPSSSQEGGVVGLNFHQSKEVLINDSNGSIYTVGFGSPYMVSLPNFHILLIPAQPGTVQSPTFKATCV